jgi:hypothetical protein
MFPSLIVQNVTDSFFPQKALHSRFRESSIETLVSLLLKIQQKKKNSCKRTTLSEDGYQRDITTECT